MSRVQRVARTRLPSNNGSQWQLRGGLAAAFLKVSLRTSWDLIVLICPLFFNTANNVLKCRSFGVIYDPFHCQESLSAADLLLVNTWGLLNRKDFSVLPPKLSRGSTVGWEEAESCLFECWHILGLEMQNISVKGHRFAE